MVATYLGSRTLCSYEKESLALADFTAVAETVLTGAWALTPDAHIGKIIEITSGSGAGYRALITDNDATTVTCAGAKFVTAGVAVDDDGAVWTFGEKPSTINKWLGIIQPFEPTEKNTLIDVRGIGFNRNIAFLLPTKKDVGATVEIFPQNFEMFEFMLGKKSGAGTVADPIVYAETERIPSMAIAAVARGPAGTEFIREFLGCKVNEATLSSREYEPLRMRLTMAIKDVQKGTTLPTVTTDITKPFMFAQTKLTINAVAYVMKSWSLTVREGLIKDWHDSGDGSRVPLHITEGARYYELSGEITPSDPTLWDLMNDAITKTQDLADFTAVEATKLTGSWALMIDAEIGNIVRITSGTGKEYTAVITDNDATSVTCAGADFVTAGVAVDDDGAILLGASLLITRGTNDTVAITLGECALEEAPVPLPDTEVVRQTFTLRARSCSVSEVTSA